MVNQQKRKLVIGPSTGWLYAAGINNIPKQEKILEKAEASAAEICLAVMEPGNIRIASLGLENSEVKPAFQNMSYTSLHLPDYNPDLSIQ